MKKEQLILTILGSSGGAARAFLSLLNHAVKDIHNPLYSQLQNCSIHLIDIKQKPQSYFKDTYPALYDSFTFHVFDLSDNTLFRNHLQKTGTNLVIDASLADAVEMLTCCNEFGVHYINTALQSPKIDANEHIKRFSLLERQNFFEEHKPTFTQMTGIICSGMNPGVVQWMAIKLMKQNPTEIPLACFIVEHDTTFYHDPTLIKEKTVYSTWSPAGFLEEGILNYPLFMKHQTPILLCNTAYEQEFKVTLGDKQFFGCLMGHEEVINLGKLYDMEVGFLYRINDYMTQLIHDNQHNVDELWSWNHHVLNPETGQLIGEDLIGVLLVYKDKEVYMYNTTATQHVYTQYGTNATYFQVACGVYGALASLLLDDLPLGCYFVDELLLNTDSKYDQYLSYYMKDFVIGENHTTDGLLFDRMKKIE